MKPTATIQPMSALDLGSGPDRDAARFESAPWRMLTAVGATGAVMSAVIWWNATINSLPSLSTKMAVGSIAALTLAAAHLLLFCRGATATSIGVAPRTPSRSRPHLAGASATSARGVRSLRNRVMSAPLHDRHRETHRSAPRPTRKHALLRMSTHGAVFPA